jgi:hypothetical protein
MWPRQRRVTGSVPQLGADADKFSHEVVVVGHDTAKKLPEYQ